MSFGDSKVGGFSGASRSNLGVSHFDKMGASVGSKNNGSSSDSFQQALKEEGVNNGLSSLLSDRSSPVSKSEGEMNNSSSAPSSADTAENSTQSASKTEGSTGIADSLMSLIAKLMNLMADGADKGDESVSAKEPASNATEAKGAEGSSATEGVMGADSTSGDEGAMNPQDPVQLLQMMLELITQLISMLQDKASSTEADSTQAAGESGMPSVSEKADKAPNSVGSDGSGKEGKGATSAGEALGNSDAMGGGDAEEAGDSGKVAETEGVMGTVGTTGIEGGMDAQDTMLLLQELLKLLIQMTEMMQGKPADAASEPEDGKGIGKAAESVSPSGKAEAANENGSVAEEGTGRIESGDSQGIEQLLEPLLALLTELVSMMQGESTNEAVGTNSEEGGEAKALIGDVAGKESSMDVGEASGVEEMASGGEVSNASAEGGMTDILKLLAQIIEMLQGQSAEAGSGEEVTAVEEGRMKTSGASDAMGAEGADTEGGAPETLGKDQLLEKVFTLLTQLLTQMMQQMGGSKLA